MTTEPNSVEYSTANYMTVLPFNETICEVAIFDNEHAVQLIYLPIGVYTEHVIDVINAEYNYDEKIKLNASQKKDVKAKIEDLEFFIDRLKKLL